jgi:hypothetical protein
MLPKNPIAIVSILWSLSSCAAPAKNVAPGQGRGANRVATLLVAGDFLNEVFREHLKSEIVPELTIAFPSSPSGESRTADSGACPRTSAKYTFSTSRLAKSPANFEAASEESA